MAPPPGAPARRSPALLCAKASFASIALVFALAMLLHGRGPLGLAFDLPFRLLCHRLPERVLSLAGVPTPLCSRCTGLWLGLSASVVLGRPALRLGALRVAFALGLAFMLGEVASQELGLRPLSHATRVLSGLLVSVPFGGTLGALIERELSPRSRR
ncbi:MAG TPA: DUF2085 domain-containing protein [Polyangiaceae bacterium]|nr:DUF2085 domain-containing protein [Polyangiaceae bacterium]